MTSRLLVLLGLLLPATLWAAEVEILDVQFTKRGQTWSVRTMLQHPDSGWDHYADLLRVVTADGEVLGTAMLTRPHVDEQPFTPAQIDMKIPRGVTTVFVEAHDTQDGWAKSRVKVDLLRRDGPRYRVSAL